MEKSEYELSSSDPLEQIHANYPDDIFNTDNKKKAERETNNLFGDKAKKSFQEVSAHYVTILGWVMLGIPVAILLTRVWHLLAPECWR